jgi:hypothetical protein
MITLEQAGLPPLEFGLTDTPCRRILPLGALARLFDGNADASESEGFITTEKMMASKLNLENRRLGFMDVFLELMSYSVLII